MKKIILNVLVLFCAVVSANISVAGKLVELDSAIESNALRIKVSKDLTGIVSGQTCPSCEIEIVTVTPETQLYVNGVATSLSKASLRSGKPGTAIFNIKSRKVTKILSYE